MGASKPNKKIKEYLAALGEPYQIKVIDLENCIYRDLKNGYDIEVCGLDNGRKKLKSDVYVWCKINGFEIVDRALGIQSFENLKTTLDQFVMKYSSMKTS